MEEIWKDVVGYEGRYKVSNYGNVKSVIFNHKGKEKNLVLLNGKDYLLVRLYKDGKGKMQRVHRLVAEAFIDNPENYPVVNHKNWNKHDNRVENLEWCSYSYNNSYVPNREYNRSKKRISNRSPLLSSKKVICVETGETFSSAKEASAFACVERSGITKCCIGRQLTAGGYHWKYLDSFSNSMKQDVHIPDNIAKWITQHDGVNLSINFNSASADSGYAHMLWYTVTISMLTRTCNRCGYDPIWNPDDSESKCIRHTYNSWRYDAVFVWSEFQNSLSLEKAFEVWERKQSGRHDAPVVKMVFGQTGWK